MPCPHCVSTDQLFDDSVARRELARLAKKGPSASTRLLIDAVRRFASGSLLDIGGGVGAIQRALAAEGASRVTGVDASRAYLKVAESEAVRLGFGDRARWRFGDFVELAPSVEDHDVVTLDRVLCCYPDVAGLVSASAARARRAYGVVFPKERWWTHLGARAINVAMWVMRSDYRAYVHGEAHIDALATEAGLVPDVRTSTWLWNVRTWTRAA